MGRRSSEWAPHRVAGRVFLGHDLLRAIRRAFRTQEIASARRDPRTGTVEARGMSRTADGWRITKSRKRRTYRPGEVDKPRAARSSARAGKRKADRAARSSRAAAKPAADTNPNLARKVKRGPGGQMAGSISGVPKMPTPRKAVGLQRLGCDWCRGTGTRPLTIGKGRVKTVIGVARCAHSWAVPNNGPGQNAPDRRDSLVCPPCQNTGKATVKVTKSGSKAAEADVPCFTCNGWILHW